MSLIRETVSRSFNQERVDIETFASDPRFCNKPLYPRQLVLLKLIFLEEMTGYEEDVLTEWIRGGDRPNEVVISPQIRERRDWLRDNGYEHFPEVVMVGGRRSSKGFITSLALGKVMYDTYRLGDPGAYYGIDPDKEIYFMCVAAALAQAKAFQYADLVSVVTRCNAIKGAKVLEESFSVPTEGDKRYMAEMQRRGIRVGRDFAKLRGVPRAANADSIRGSATMGIAFDEMAFMMDVEGNRSSAAECYEAATPALAQFGKHGIVFCCSSPYSKVGKFYERWGDSMALDGDKPKFPGLFSLSFPSWELYKDWKHSRHRQILEKGSLMMSPDVDIETIDHPGDRDKVLEARFAEQANPEKFKVERRGKWAEVVDAYLLPEMVDRAFCTDFQGRPVHANTQGGSYSYDYKMHCDPSSTTAGFGFSVAHVEQFPNQAGVLEPHVIFDYVQRWNPKDFPNGTIDYIKVMEELLVWIDLFRPYELTFDQWNSAAPIQWLREKLNEKRLGNTRIYETTATSLKNWNRWEFFKTMLNLGIVHIPLDCPDSEYAANELKFLQVRNGTHVDKQNVGPVQTKDIADTIMICTFDLLNGIAGFTDSAFGTTGAQFGAPGGYAIGGTKGQQDRLSSMQDFYRATRQPPANNPTRGMRRR